MRTRPPSTRLAVLLLLAALWAASGCRPKADASPPLATPGVTLNYQRAPLGSVLEITYRFQVAQDAKFPENYRVMMHVVDADEELMWTDDHNPAVPTTQWKPGQVVEYTRTVFVPIYPYIGEASIQVGLYSLTTQKRVPLSGENVGQWAYEVARLQLLPQTENVMIVFKDGWQPTEVADNNPNVEWQWTKKEATISFRNPKKDAILYLDLDAPGGVFEQPQAVEVRMGDQKLDSFTLQPKDQLLRKVPLTAAQLGAAEMAELKIVVDKTFVPALVQGANSHDPRELGVRVFHAYLDARGKE